MCKFEAITIKNFLAYIDPNACKLCRACVTVCPTDAIHELNFPPRRVKKEDANATPKKKPVKKEAVAVKPEEKTIDLKEIAKKENKEKE